MWRARAIKISFKIYSVWSVDQAFFVKAYTKLAFFIYYSGPLSARQLPWPADNGPL